ncbi:MAG: sterol desaturase family protein [Alphaproteobacteria bacterium]|nr:sterol desaturase family protein [Alphaproteobacteria bacterium]
MFEHILANEPWIRFSVFLGIFASIAVWEVVAPRRALGVSRWLRWSNNIGIVVLNTALLRIVFPTAAVGLALFASAEGWGLLNHLVLPVWIEILVAVVLLDLAIYLQHVMFHAVPALWRLHRMHHSDLDFDVTTGARFHPIEILFSMGIKLAVVAALGPAAVAVLLFEVLLNGSSMFNHGNIRLPIGLDRVLRWFVVTPDMHRVHHAIAPAETNSNFGFNLPWWDRLFGTYRAQPSEGHVDMTIGINQFRAPRELRLDRMLTQPFRGAATDYPVNREQ